VAAVVIALALVACGKPALEPAASPPLEVAVAQPEKPRVATAPPAPSPAAAEPAVATEPDPEPLTMPKSWSGPIVPGLAFTDALRKARGARDAFARLAAPAAKAKEPAVKAWFAQAQTQVDQAREIVEEGDRPELEDVRGAGRGEQTLHGRDLDDAAVERKLQRTDRDDQTEGERPAHRHPLCAEQALGHVERDRVPDVVDAVAEDATALDDAEGVSTASSLIAAASGARITRQCALPIGGSAGRLGACVSVARSF